MKNSYAVEMELPNTGRDDSRVIIEVVRASSFDEAAKKAQEKYDRWVAGGHYKWARVRNVFQRA